MTPERWSRIKALFADACELPPVRRAEFLAREAADDPDLLAEVQSLLDSHERPGDFLDSVSPALRFEAFTAAPAANRIGERIGAYRIVGVLGTGGMGDVFKAVRDDDQYRAEVAIKLMRADVSGNLVEQRFRTERQILAGLDHRNIARLLDGGTTDGGTPYVVMELVVGEPIDRYCESRNLTTRERVQLFLQVCAAVSYAHQHLVVHRDLKPNNILASTDGSIKLLDFGIAKLIETSADTAGADAADTLTSLRAMTLDYASPEQLSGGTVTTVSDVYSLGVVLYRLLTGQSPYGARSTDAQRIAQILSDTTPTRPSLVRPLDSDLDNILLMALRKEPQRRYGSAEQFANDLRNYLAGLPVHARGNAFSYRFGKFVRRRRIEIAAATIVLVSLIAALGFSMHEARVAEDQRMIAQRHFDSVRKLANRLFVFHDEIARLPGSTKAREMLVKTSLEYLDTLYKESSTDRALQEELGFADKKVGDIQGSVYTANVGDTAGSMLSYAKAVALLEPLYRRDPKNGRIGTILAKTYFQQSRRTIYMSGSAAALPIALKAAALAESLKPVLTDEFERMGLLGNAYSIEAEVFGGLGRMAEARESLDKMILAAEEYSRAHPEDERGLSSLSAVYNNAAVIGSPGLSAQEAYARSAILLPKGMAADEALLALKPDDASYQWSLAETRVNLADLYYNHGEYAKAIDLNRKAAAVMAIRDPQDAKAQLVANTNDVGLAKGLAKTGAFDEAEALFISAARSLREISARGEDLQADYQLAELDIRRGEMYLARGRSAEARVMLKRGMSSARKVQQAMPEENNVRVLLSAAAAALDRT